MEGKLKHWNEEKGFGFISSKVEPNDIFIHISALKKMSRRPVVGDLITFQIHIDNNGKKRATNAQIKGVAPINTKNIKQKKHNKNSSSNPLLIIATVGLVSMGSYFVYSYQSKNESALVEQIPAPIKSKKKRKKYNDKFNCAGKVYCSDMTSCEEAKYYLNNCTGTKIDGDNDGVPCESQWCN